MKKGLILGTFLLLSSIFTFADGEGKKVQLDPKVRHGKLDNGLTYYIRANAMPENRAEFYIVNNVGAILETDAQDGLAHFCEHMAFNGTKNFPGKGVLNFLETNGVKFGHNVNAFTSLDVTAYNLSNVPLRRSSIVDSCLLVLHDWANYVSFEEDEIDKERGVIHEEWRTRRSPNMRMQQVIRPVLYEGSKYAKRDVIGKLDVIDNCSYETLRSFYRDWYRPELQALIIVGDFDATEMEAKVKKVFAKLPVDKNAKERKYFPVPDHKETKVAIASDKEAQNSMVRVYYKHDVVPKEQKDLTYYNRQMDEALFSLMLNNRLQELTQKENPPFIYGYSGYNNMVTTKDAYMSLAMAPNGKILEALEALLNENQRVKKYGFTASELKRAKEEIISKTKKQYNERNTQKNTHYVWQYFSHFLQNEPAPGIEFEYAYVQKYLPKVQVNQINKLASEWIREENVVATVTGPEIEEIPMPTEEQVLSVFEKCRTAKLEAYEDNVSDAPLVTALPPAGSIVKENQNDDFNSTEWELSNGAKVIIKSTDFKEDQILFNAFSTGGYSLTPTEDLPSIQMATSVLSNSGLGEFEAMELRKKLSGKNVRVYPYIAQYNEGLRGESTPEDFETMLQLTHMHFTAPRFEEKAFNAYMSRMKAYLENKSSDPNAIFRDSVTMIMSDYHPRVFPFSTDMLEKVQYNKLDELYAQRFANAGDFTFVFAGNISPEEAKPMLEKYLGSLPGNNNKEQWKDNQIRSPKGKIARKLVQPMETPKSTVFVNYNGAMPYNFENALALRAISHILDLRYTERIREDEGGTYGVGINERATDFPIDEFQLMASFTCDPERVDMLKAIIHEEIKKLMAEGPSSEDLTKAKEYFIKSRQEDLKENRFWLNAIRDKELHKKDMLALENYEEEVQKLSTKAIQKKAQELFGKANQIEVVMSPE